MAITQNTPVLIGGTLSTSIKSAHIKKLTEVSKATGFSLSGMLGRAIEQWLAIEAPVYMDQAKRARG